MKRPVQGFTLIELLVTITIVTILAAIMLPALSGARQSVRKTLNINNQRQTVGSVTGYSLDHKDRFPQSVATIGSGKYWNWREPTIVTGFQKRGPRLHRSMSAYLKEYMENADTLYCSNGPRDYKYWQAAWDAAESWDNPDPETGPVDPLYGTYCTYWNYTGYLVDGDRLFNGPDVAAGRRGKSKLLISDYIGFDHWMYPGDFISCEKFDDADIASGTAVAPDLWLSHNGSRGRPKIGMQAGYIDGHVQYHPDSEMTAMKAILWPALNKPYPDGVGPGNIFIPSSAAK